MKRRQFNALTASMLLAGGSVASRSAFAARERVQVQLDWLPGGDKSFVYAGVKQGFFAAEGLDVDIMPGRGSSNAVTKLASGAADVGFAGIAALMQAATSDGNIPVKAVMSLYSKQPDALFTVKGSSIRSLKDVVGKTVATATFSSSNALWPLVLEKNGIKPSQVKLLKVDPSTLAPMLAQGRVDATINWITVEPGFRSVLQQAGKDLQVLMWSNFGLDGYGWSAMASEKMIKDRPDVLRRYMRALRKSLQFAMANPDQSAADLKSFVPETDPAVAAAEFRSSMPLIVNDISRRDGLGKFEPKLLDATWKWVAESINVDPKKLDPESLIDPRFLPA